MATIRLAEAGDLPGIADIVNHYVVDGTQHLGTTPLTLEQVEAFARDPMHPCFVALDGAELLGAAWSKLHKSREAYAWAVDVAIYLRSDAGGDGVGSALHARLIECLRAQGYVSAVAVIVMPNPASVRVHEKLGFRRIGVMPAMGHKQGTWRDVGIWHLSLCEAPPNPPVIRPVGEVLTL